MELIDLMFYAFKTEKLNKKEVSMTFVDNIEYFMLTNGTIYDFELLKIKKTNNEYQIKYKRQRGEEKYTSKSIELQLIIEKVKNTYLLNAIVITDKKRFKIFNINEYVVRLYLGRHYHTFNKFETIEQVYNTINNQ